MSVACFTELATLEATVPVVCFTVSVTVCMNSLVRISARASRYDVLRMADMLTGPSAAVSHFFVRTPTRNTKNALTRPSAVAPITMPPTRAPAPPPMSWPSKSLRSESSMPPMISALIMTREYRRASPTLVGLKPHTSTIARTKSRHTESMVTVLMSGERDTAEMKNAVLAARFVSESILGMQCSEKNWISKSSASSPFCRNPSS